MGHRLHETRKEIEALLDSLEGVQVRAALFEGCTQREIAAELGTSKSRVNRLAHDAAAPSPLREATGYALAMKMLSRTPIVEIAAARCWTAGLRASAPLPLAELREAVAADLERGASVRSVPMAMPAPGTAEAQLLLKLLREWSRSAFADVTREAEGLRVGVCRFQGSAEASSLLPRVPAVTVAALLGVPVADVPADLLDTALRPIGAQLAVAS